MDAGIKPHAEFSQLNPNARYLLLCFCLFEIYVSCAWKNWMIRRSDGRVRPKKGTGQQETRNPPAKVYKLAVSSPCSSSFHKADVYENCHKTGSLTYAQLPNGSSRLGSAHTRTTKASVVCGETQPVEYPLGIKEFPVTFGVCRSSSRFSAG